MLCGAHSYCAGSSSRQECVGLHASHRSSLSRDPRRNHYALFAQSTGMYRRSSSQRYSRRLPQDGTEGCWEPQLGSLFIFPHLISKIITHSKMSKLHKHCQLRIHTPHSIAKYVFMKHKHSGINDLPLQKQTNKALFMARFYIRLC